MVLAVISVSWAKEKKPAAIESKDLKFGVSSDMSDFDKPTATTGKVFGFFELAAKQYGLPVDVLLAVSLHESGWSMAKPDMRVKDQQHTGWGYMGLGGKTDRDAVRKAAALLAKPADLIKTDAQMNILAGAALLDDARSRVYKGNVKKARNTPLSKYHPVFVAYADSGDRTNDLMFADEVMMLLHRGYTTKLPSGEVLTVLERPELDSFANPPIR